MNGIDTCLVFQTCFSSNDYTMYFAPTLIPLFTHVLLVSSINLKISKAGKCWSPTTSKSCNNLEWMHRKKIICLATFGRQVQNNCNFCYFFVTGAKLGQGFFQLKKTLSCHSTKKYSDRLAVKQRKVFNAKVMPRILAEWANFRPAAPRNRDIFISQEIGSSLDIAENANTFPTRNPIWSLTNLFPKKKLSSLLIRLKKENNSSQFEFWHLLKSKDLIYFLFVRACAS